jgi:serine/threonine-protein kinase
MELIKGRTLREIVDAQGPFGAQEALVFGLDLCRALAAVHRAGLIHGDVKAQNVMREEGGRIVLMDFGAAALLTRDQYFFGQRHGTPVYLAPEVLEGCAATVQSDLYSLGVLLYYLVTGEYPVAGRSPDDLREAHAHRHRRLLRDVRPDLPSSFVRVIDDAMAASPVERPGSAGAMELLLQGATDRSFRPQPDPPLAHSVAVLPFVDLSPTKSLEYFCEGIAEEIINILTRVSGVRVVARGSAFRFKDGADVRTVATALNVGTVLEGSVRAFRDELRIIATLVDATSGYQLWSQRFDRRLADVFAVQDEIAAAVLSAIGVQIGNRSARGDAYSFYLEGRHYWNKRTESSLQRSVTSFQTAIEKDPDYAEAHAGLAEAYATLGLYGALPPHEIMPKAKAAAREAIDLVEALSGPYVTLGCVTGVYDWAWSDAERHFQQSILFNPRRPDSHHWYAINYLVPIKRFDDARRELNEAAEADPLSTPIRVSCGLLGYFSGRYDEALQDLRRSLDLDPGSATARMFIGLTHAELGGFDEAIRELQTALALSASPEISAALGYVFARAGSVDRARDELGKLLLVANQRYVSSSLVAQIHAGLGDTVPALDWLARAGAERAADLAWLRIRPVFKGLQREGLFESLVEKIGQPA